MGLFPEMKFVFSLVVFYSMAIVGPVSYTHLDVYKRQDVYDPDLTLKGINLVYRKQNRKGVK